MSAASDVTTTAGRAGSVSTADPDPFNDTFVAMAGARAVIAATRLGVFDALAERRTTPQALADALGLDRPGTEALLTALAALGYVQAELDGVYSPTAAGLRLTAGAEDSVAHFIGTYNAYAWDMLGGLDDVLRGKRTAASHERPPGKLQATVLDLPASAEVGRRIVAEEGFAERVSFREGDALTAELGTEVDVISIFNLLHHLAPQQVQQLLARARAALRVGGCVVVGETERSEPGKPTSVNGAMSGLVYFASSATRNYTARELAGWLQQAGFDAVDVHRSGVSPWRLTYIARN